MLIYNNIINQGLVGFSSKKNEVYIDTRISLISIKNFENSKIYYLSMLKNSKKNSLNKFII